VVEDQVGEGGDHPLEVRSNGKNRGDTGAPDKRKPRAICGAFRGALGRTRTCDLLIRRPNHAVLCGSLKCVWGLYKALPVLWGARLFYLVPVTLPSTLRMQILARRVPERVCALALFNPPHSAIADKPKEPAAQRGSWYHHFHALPWSHELVGYNRDTTELYMRHFYNHWVGNKDSVRPKAFEAIVDTFARPDAIKASFG
jgi:hypothetical protein